MSKSTTDRRTRCHVCEEDVPVDGENAGVFAGQVTCRRCLDEPVVFVAECVDCEWSYRWEERALNRYHARVRVQQEGNSHESLMKLDEENHETVWRVVESNA